MAFRVIARWFSFAVYCTLFFTLPLALLWDTVGLAMGILFAGSFLILLGFQGTERIARRLKIKLLSPAQAPTIFAMVNEYCRRLQIPAPKVAVMETPALNLAVFGFSRRNSFLVLTRGALDELKREELSALIGRELCYLWYGDIFCESWLSQFLAVMDSLVATSHPASQSHSRRVYPFRLFLRQVLLYPLSLVPAFLLRGGRDAATFDLTSARVSQKPHALAEGLRRAEALVERIPFQIPFSTRHLFLICPPAQDPLARVFFGADDLGRRIRNIEANLTRVTALS